MDILMGALQALAFISMVLLPALVATRALDYVEHTK